MDRRSQTQQTLRNEKRRPKKRHAVGLLLLLAFVVLLVFLPRILTSQSVLPTLINRFAGLEPIRVTLAEVNAGWFSPVQAAGIEITTNDGLRIARIGKIETTKGLLSWITNSSDLGMLRVSNLEAAAVAANGTTNVEQALAPLLFSQPAQDSAAGASPIGTTGTLEFVDCKLMVSEAERPERWVMVIPSARLALPADGQLVGPADMQATITEVSGTLPGRTGSLSAAVQPSAAGGLEASAALDTVPVDFWHVLKARLPELPVQELQGHLTCTVVANMVNDAAWNVSVGQFSATDLCMVAPELVGEAPVMLKAISGTVNCSLENSLMHLSGAQLSCDFANATAEATVPWPLQMPTASEPLVPGAIVKAQGSLNLPGLVNAASTLIPMRNNTQLLAGTAQFSLDQRLDDNGQPLGDIKLQLADLKAVAEGQDIVWQEPLNVALSANKSAGTLSLAADVSAEFVQFKAAGTMESGTLRGNVDLSMLQQRLSQWVELPITDMQGGVELGLAWSSPQKDLLDAQGKLNTTPVNLSTTTGGVLSEPAWNGNFTCQVGMAGGSPESVNSAQLVLESPGELLKFNLQQPLSLAATQVNPSPAAFAIDLRTDLANCMRRGNVWLSESPDMDVRGNLQLAVSGVMDLSHVEVVSANWGCEPLVLATSQMTLSEPRLIGKFGGRIDTKDLTRLVVDVLQVQSTSFSIGAEDQAKPGSNQSRIGQAMWRVDLNRLMRSVGADASLANQATDPAASKISATGMLQGQLAWEVSPQAAGINTRIDGQDIVVLSQTGTSQPSTIWREPNLVANLAGTWLAATGAVDVPKFQLQLPWLNYDGKVAYESGEQGQTIRVTGQAAYDAAQLAARLKPFTGEQIQLQGQQTVPIEVSWGSGADVEQPFMTGLNATARLAWEQGAVAGIPIGKADVPVTIESGNLMSAAEIPVSGGALRWDLESDLAADALVIRQKPMLVLDNVQITDQMCQGWLKYVAPLMADVTSVDGRLSLRLDQAALTPAEPLKQSVVGQIVIHDATVGPGPISNQIILITKQLEAIRKQDLTRTVSSTQKVWLTMPEQRIDFQMLDGRVIHQNLNVKIGDANITTTGSVGLDGQMDMKASLPIPDDWAAKSPWLAGFRGQSLDFPIRGTLSNPQLDSQLLSKLGKETVQNAADGLLRQGLNRGLDKLLGGQDNAPAEGAANPNPNPIQGIGEQILKGNGLNLPGLFPVFGGQQTPPGK